MQNAEFLEALIIDYFCDNYADIENAEVTEKEIKIFYFLSEEKGLAFFRVVTLEKQEKADFLAALLRDYRGAGDSLSALRYFKSYAKEESEIKAEII